MTDEKIKKYFPNNSNTTNMDTLEYRIKECQTHGGDILDISHLELNQFPHSLIPKTVKYLFCSDNFFTQINSLTNLPHLEVFDCCTNKLTVLPELPPSIIEITCRNNLLEQINISNYDNLKRLDISHNTNIKEIKNKDSNKLELLYCTNNSLTELPPMKSLKKLICCNNSIKLLKGDNFINLNLLDCENNKITHISNLPQLEEAFCDNNLIETLNDLTSLKILSCTDNKITNIPYLNKLEELVCDYKKILIPKEYKVNKATVRKDKIYITFDACTK